MSATPPPASRRIIVRRRLDRAELERLGAALDRRGGADVDRTAAGAIEVDVRSLRPCDLGTVDGLARLALAARCRGLAIRLVGVRPELRELVALAGLTRILPCSGATPSRASEVSRGARAGRRAGRSGRCRERT